MTTKELILELKISKVISNYIPLKYRGNSYEAICPFHADTKPSLKVNDEKGLFKCFACGAGGDVFNFVMNYRDISFPEALGEIALYHNIPSEDFKSSSSDRTSVALDLLSYAQRVYFEEAKKNENFTFYIASRDISIEFANHLHLCFAPDRDIILDLIKDDSFKLDLALELGLIRSTSSGYHDTFKNRIMFPISTEQGACVGFCSRSIDEQMPKYLNSFIFKKSELLYGLNLSKKEIQRQSSVLIVEGFMDFVTLYQHGIKNVVACMGTAISESCILRLNELSSEIILGLDSDEAGIKAMERINKLMLKKGIVPYIINYAPKKDADEFIKASDNATSELRERLNSSRTMLDFEIEKLAELNRSEEISRKIKSLISVFSLVADLGLTILATERILQYAKMIGILSSEQVLLDEYSHFLKATRV